MHVLVGIWQEMLIFGVWSFCLLSEGSSAGGAFCLYLLCDGGVGTEHIKSVSTQGVEPLFAAGKWLDMETQTVLM